MVVIPFTFLEGDFGLLAKVSSLFFAISQGSMI
jgi:hypothetical protein